MRCDRENLSERIAALRRWHDAPLTPETQGGPKFILARISDEISQRSRIYLVENLALAAEISEQSRAKSRIEYRLHHPFVKGLVSLRIIAWNWSQFATG